jgi:hypothetical protein
VLRKTDVMQALKAAGDEACFSVHVSQLSGACQLSGASVVRPRRAVAGARAGAAAAPPSPRMHARFARGAVSQLGRSARLAPQHLGCAAVRARTVHRHKIDYHRHEIDYRPAPRCR